MTLTSEPLPSARTADIIVLTGPSRAGKTTICRRVVGEVRSRCLSVAGVLTEDGLGEGGACLQVVRDLLSDERRLLARTRADDGQDRAQSDTHAPSGSPGASRLRWEFDARGLAFGRRALSAAAELGCDLLVVDQIGPLEVRHRRGWTGVYELVGAGRYDLALIVVNPNVVDEFVAGLHHPCRVLGVDDAVRDELPAAIVSAHWP